MSQLWNGVGVFVVECLKLYKLFVRCHVVINLCSGCGCLWKDLWLSYLGVSCVLCVYWMAVCFVIVVLLC